MNRLLQIKNRKNGESKVITLTEFNEKFANELDLAISDFSQHEADRGLLLPFKIDTRDYKAEFYFELRWNFNTYANCEWFIERFIR